MSIPCPICNCTHPGTNYVGRHRLSNNWKFVYINQPGWLAQIKVNLNGGAFHG